MRQFCLHAHIKIHRLISACTPFPILFFLTVEKQAYPVTTKKTGNQVHTGIALWYVLHQSWCEQVVILFLISCTGFWHGRGKQCWLSAHVRCSVSWLVGACVRAGHSHINQKQTLSKCSQDLQYLVINFTPN